MRKLTDECTDMARAMLDAELYAIARRAAARESNTPLQQAVNTEIARRNLPFRGELRYG
ncbi:hypothetical protein M2336_002767 [Sphingobium sp. B1D7B]|uniref:hypothetical protein n=1 Tax=Sphingobium TaxID=165695 RepID=UPI0015EB43FA|nr:MULTISPECIES: hypothetical protein [Sphingobium]MCW2350239.1 hypothetical protein [Sphingobium sp. B12D2B]MCW2361655.1 hypothetical protein [Sphingobium sp. B10D3B]MCW2366550.1 hypothetical protein [Sphingobium sp. B7D2B]MCW2369343.1 hypothetical protein [Sphingobium sp. B11D3D]MCW2387854.1 hypothetical protein [Sphingobium sp. B11D3B]